ncbi:MAG: hypothetical protein RIM23_22785 [Coleofasciculus sp. G3-WIS-01]
MARLGAEGSGGDLQGDESKPDLVLKEDISRFAPEASLSPRYSITSC